MIEMGEREDVTARAGLPLIVETMRALGIEDLVKKELPIVERKSEFPPEKKLETLVTLIAAGGDRIEDIRILNEDKGLVRLLDGPFPSPDALLDFLGAFHDPNFLDTRPTDKKAFVPPESEALRGLDAINRSVVSQGADRGTTTATIDHDGTIIESHKRDALMAYEGTIGYQPLVAVWAEEQLVVADEFRDGNVAGGEDPLSSAKRAFEALPEWVTRRFFRGDSASYYAPLLKYLVGEEIGFSISADMTTALRACCLAVPESQWVLLEKRIRDQVETAEVEFAPGNWDKNAKPLRYVVLRIKPLQIDLFDELTPKYLAVVSNRQEMTAAELVKWHWEKAGTIEHVHRVMKDELAAAVMPSGKFQVNAAWFRINVLTFNLLTILKRRALPKSFWLARPKRLRFELFTLPAKLSTHQSQLSSRVSAAEPRIEYMIGARKKLLEMFQARRTQ